MKLQVRNDGFCNDTTNFINHEHRDQVDSEHGDVKLVDSNVEKIELEVSELEDESLDED